MSSITKQILFWSPRILCILMAIFLGLFALDVFSEGYSFGETILALLIHLIPTYLVVIVLLIAWKREWLGAILFFTLAIIYIIMVRRLDWSLLISGPLFIVGILCLVNWKYKAQLRT